MKVNTTYFGYLEHCLLIGEAVYLGQNVKKQIQNIIKFNSDNWDNYFIGRN